MKFIDRYRRLTLWNKIAFWGALSSLMAIPLSIGFYISSKVDIQDYSPVKTDIYVEPYTLEISDNYFEVYSRLKNTLWSQQVSGHISKATISDIDSDGKSEVIIGVRGEGKDIGKIFVFDSNGNSVWIRDTTSPPNYSGGRSGRLMVTDFEVADLFGKGRKQIISISIDAHGWYQTRICIFDYDGTLLSSYWHPGHLGPIKIGSKFAGEQKVIAVAGINNDLARNYEGEGYPYCLFALDPRNVRGEAPPYYGKAGAGSQLWYGIFFT